MKRDKITFQKLYKQKVKYYFQQKAIQPILKLFKIILFQFYEIYSFN